MGVAGPTCSLQYVSSSVGPSEDAPGTGRTAGPCLLTEACGDMYSCPQYKVLSVLPGSGMGIAVTTPSTQKVSGRRWVAQGCDQASPWWA